jgi:hypothetical protein
MAATAAHWQPDARAGMPSPQCLLGCSSNADLTTTALLNSVKISPQMQHSTAV